MGKVKVEYSTPQVAKATWYELTKTNSQNLIAGYGNFEGGSGSLEVNLKKDLIPPIKIKFKKVDADGNPLNGIKFTLYHRETTEDKFNRIIDTDISKRDEEKGEDGWVIFNSYYPNTLDEQKFKVVEEFPNGYDVYDGLDSKYSGKGFSPMLTANWKGNAWEFSATDTEMFFRGIYYNYPIIENLTITKKDSQTGEKLDGAKFNITLENVSSIKGYSTTGGSKIILKDVSQEKYAEFMEGILKLERLAIVDQTKPIKITIEESQAPLGYKKLDGKIILTLQRVDEGGNVVKNKALRELKLVDVKVEGNISSEKEFNPNNDVKVENHAISLEIKNIPLMNIGGVVWEDSRVDGKVVTKSNQVYDKEPIDEGLGGVKVYLYDGQEKVAETVSAPEAKTITYTGTDGNEKTYNLAKGEYVFIGVQKSENYHVKFEYDGMTYETVEKGTESNNSKADEIEREAFNNKFKTINKNGSKQQDNYINLNYNQTEAGKSKLITKDANGNILEQYIMRAKAKNTETNWANTWTQDGQINKNSDALNLNCGLNTRYFDLALGLDVQQALVTINGKKTSYTYEQILTEQEIAKANNFDQSKDLPYLFLRLDKEGNLYKDVNEQDVKYNLYLYESDYNYRIDDYKTGLTNNSNPGDADKVKNNSYMSNELEVYVMYKTIIYNQSSEKGYATKLINYVPEHYEFVGAEIGKEDAVTLTTAQEGQNVIINLTNDDGNLVNQAEGLSQEITLYYKIAKDQETEKLKIGKLENNVEIYEYYTEKGIVDYDSVPGNNLQTEDDIDTALPLNVQINEQQRIITGTVFEDTDKNGKLDNENAEVNDVIVQLIEKKEITIGGTTQEYEYIWQETTSGVGKSLKKVSMGGTGITMRPEISVESKNKLSALDFNNDGMFSKEESEEYIRLYQAFVVDEYIKEFDFNDDNLIDMADKLLIEEWMLQGPVSTKEGMYAFSGFIPGNYIIRFIYGDGRTYDLTQNQMDYNGQDYKSTYLTGTTEGEQNYLREWYNNTEYVGNTKATDNPNRRLEVMGYSKVIDKNIGTELNSLNSKLTNLDDTQKEKVKDVLDKTWMCAETAKINVPISSTTAQNAGNISEHTQVGYNNVTDIKFTDISLGLMERPKTRLELEKHITGVKINHKDGYNIISFNFNYSNREIESVSKGSGFEDAKIEDRISSDRSERGKISYTIGIDKMQELNQAELMIDYKYIVTNKSDADYYKQNVIDGTFFEKLELNELEEISRNELSQFYYTGNKDSYDKPVTIKVEAGGIQEVVNPKFDKTEPNDEDAANYYYYNVEGVREKLDKLVNNPNKKVNIVGNYGELPVEGKVDFTLTLEDKINAGAILAGKPENANYEGKYDSYIAQIVKYSIPSGRKCENSVPANLSYVHSMDTGITLDAYVKRAENGDIIGIQYEPKEGYEKINEDDEFWGETFIIRAPGGEDKQTPIQIAIIIVSAVAIVGVGIILIKKFVLKK